MGYILLLFFLPWSFPFSSTLVVSSYSFVVFLSPVMPQLYRRLKINHVSEPSLRASSSCISESKGCVVLLLLAGLGTLCPAPIHLHAKVTLAKAVDVPPVARVPASLLPSVAPGPCACGFLQLQDHTCSGPGAGNRHPPFSQVQPSTNRWELVVTEPASLVP
jgi:hypothetical protein